MLRLPSSLQVFTISATVALCGLMVAESRGDKPAGELKSYKQEISGTDVSFEMVAIPGGEFLMGSPDSEANRGDDEGPQVKVKIDPFWIGKY